MSGLVQRLRDSMHTFRTDELCREAANRIEVLEAELAICRDALEVAYDVVTNWPERLDDDGDMAVYRTTLRRLEEAVGKAAPRLLYERPEGQKLYGLHWRELTERRKADEALLRQALDFCELAWGDLDLAMSADAFGRLEKLLVVLRTHLSHIPSSNPDASSTLDTIATSTCSAPATPSS